MPVPSGELISSDSRIDGHRQGRCLGRGSREQKEITQIQPRIFRGDGRVEMMRQLWPSE